MSMPQASGLLGSLDYSGSAFALFGAFENDTGLVPVFQSPAATVDPATLPASLRVDVALVRPSTGDNERAISVILARLRDVHADRVLVCPEQLERPDTTGFAALGFEPRKSPSGDGLVYIWDPALADQPREWNDSRNWANPENFSKYRW
jgi:hypothetical protein